jgi:hypothetical protein
MERGWGSGTIAPLSLVLSVPKGGVDGTVTAGGRLAALMVLRYTISESANHRTANKERRRWLW